MGKNTKLTLYLDSDIIAAAKELAADRNTSVSELVERYLANEIVESGPERSSDLPDILVGIARFVRIPEKELTKDAIRGARLQKHMEQKS